MALQGARRFLGPPSMSVPISFRAAEGIFLRQLSPVHDEALLGPLGARCADYLCSVAGGRPDLKGLPRRFVAMLKPRRVPTERSFVLGVFLDDTRGVDAEHLAGVLYFLHPERNPDTWYIPLLLLEPSARGRGTGSTVHAAFARWAAERGARRLMVAVAEGNERARRFWCDRLGYLETDSGTWRCPGVPTRQNREYVCPLATAIPMTNRVRLRFA